VVVVDPQVGTPRRALLLVTPQARFVAPDNGVLSYVVRDYLDPPPEQEGRVRIPQSLAAYNLSNAEYWLHPVSPTFHGRDIFAPAAAHLSLGISPESLGEQVYDMGWFPAPQPTAAAGTIRGEVVYIDHFGNLVTNIPAQALAEGSTAHVKVKGRLIPGLSRTYHDPSHLPAGGLVALIGSHGHLEIAVPDGSAARSLGAAVGEGVEVTVPPAG
jgi:S-adenosylmethionine hydrolase